MPAQLFLAPGIDAALAHLFNQIQSIKAEDPFAQVTLLAPSTVTILAIRQRLGDTLNLRLFQFYGLGQSILDAVNRPVHWVSDIPLRRLVQTLLKEMDSQGELTSFNAVRDKPGFIQILMDWLREMKSQGITPEQVRDQAETAHLERDQQLARLYERYQAFLVEGGYSDSDGMLWLAAEALEASPHLLAGIGFFAVLGFDQFNPLQIRILAALARRLPDFSIYLPWDSRRPDSSLAHTRLRLTRRSLEAALHIQAVSLETSPGLPVVLDWLRKSIFEPGQEWSSGEAQTEPAVRLICAPSREAEVRRALREIKRLLQNGVFPEQVVLLAPHPGLYRRLAQAVSAEYGLPLSTERSLADSPVAAALSNLLSLAPVFPWRQTMNALRCPYIQQDWLSPEQVEQLDRLSRERPVVSGVDQWRFCLQPLPVLDEAEDDDLGPPRLARILDGEALRAILTGLEGFFSHMTPPAQDSYHAYALWIQETMLGLFDDPEDDSQPENRDSRPPSLEMIRRCQKDGEETPATRRDQAALAVVLQCLRSLLDAAVLVSPKTDGLIPWETFRSELLRLIASASIPPEIDQTGLRFLPLEEGRAIPVDYLFVFGLAEGEFPAQPPADPLYSPLERQAYPLPLERREAGEAASLWWQVVSAPRSRLTLLRPYLDESGAPWLASPYYNAVRLALPDLREETIPIAEIPAPEDCAGPAELLVALAAGNASIVPPELSQPWLAACEAQRILARRQSWQDIPEYEGFLQAPDLQAELEQRYHPTYLWSPTAINRFAKCPYIFFSERVLKLEILPDPEAGLDSLQRGNLLHAILEDLYRGLTREGIAPCLIQQDTILERLEQSCRSVFEKAPERLGFRPGALWRYEQDEMRRMLQALIEWECVQNGAAPRFSPFQQELRFGMGRGTYPAQPVSSQAGAFLLHGVIDRVDRDENGRLRVIDYKSSSATISQTDLRKCLAVQTALYALAVQQIYAAQNSPYQVAESVFLHLPKHELSGKVECPDGPAEHPVVQDIAAIAYDLTRQVIQGAFPADPSKPFEFGGPCSSTCDYASLCRVDRRAIQKARRRGVPTDNEESR